MICSKCNIEKPLSDFYKRKDTKFGVRKDCKTCANKSTINSRCEKKKSEYDKKYYLSVSTRRKIQARNYQKNNKGKVNSMVMKQHASRLKRTPSWLDRYDDIVIDFIYKTASDMTDLMGINFEVDHIIPLRGKYVSGLHVPDNLQILTKKENRLKSNKMEIKEIRWQVI